MQKNWFYYTMALYCTQEKHYRFNAWKQKKNSHFLGKRNDKILYYDCSNYYFEIEQEDGSKKYGKSKEHRPNPIIQMGLFMDGDGIPLAFSLFPGNSNKQTSLKPLEKKVLADFGCQKFIYCSDAGLGSENIRECFRILKTDFSARPVYLQNV